MNRMNGVSRLPAPALEEIYQLMEQVLSEELLAADKLKRRKIGWKVALTRIRVKLSRVSKLCKDARKEILAMTKKEEEMEKYGVEEDAESKIGTDGCPKCGQPLEQHGGVRKCPRCGTEPFESDAD